MTIDKALEKFIEYKNILDISDTLNFEVGVDETLKLIDSVNHHIVVSLHSIAERSIKLNITKETKQYTMKKVLTGKTLYITEVNFYKYDIVNSYIMEYIDNIVIVSNTGGRIGFLIPTDTKYFALYKEVAYIFGNNKLKAHIYEDKIKEEIYFLM